MGSIARSWSLPRRALINFTTTAVVHTIAFAGASLPPTAKCTRPNFALCKLHKIACCPFCHEQHYVMQRVAKAVLSGVRRLRLQKTQSVLDYLGVKTWHEVSGASAWTPARECLPAKASPRRNTDACSRCTGTWRRSASHGIGNTRTRR